jgi:hypothetical protein
MSSPNSSKGSAASAKSTPTKPLVLLSDILKSPLNRPSVTNSRSLTPDSSLYSEFSHKSPACIPALINDKPVLILSEVDKVTVFQQQTTSAVTATQTAAGQIATGAKEATKGFWNNQRLRFASFLNRMGNADVHQEVGTGNDLALRVQAAQDIALAAADVLNKGISGNRWQEELEGSIRQTGVTKPKWANKSKRSVKPTANGNDVEYEGEGEEEEEDKIWEKL